MSRLMNLLLLLSLVLTAEGRTILFCPNGDADRTAEVVRALRGVGSGDRIVFEQGIYHFHPEAAEQLWLYPSNNTGGRKQVVFALRGLKNIVVDGRGSTFVFYGRTFPFAFLHCQNVKVKNLTVTTRYPWAVNFDVKEKDDKGFRVRLGRETDYRIDSRGNISFFLGGDSLQSKAGRISLHALDGFCVNYLMTPDAVGNKDEFPAHFVGVRATDCGNHEVRFSYYGDTHPKSGVLPYRVGQPVVLNLAEKRLSVALFFDSCEGVEVSQKAVNRFGGMAFVAQRCGDVSCRRVRVIPVGEEPVSVTADIFQCINCYGRVNIVECQAGYSLDDAVNVHGDYLVVTAAHGHELQLRAMHLQQENFFPYRPGDRLEFTEPHSRRVVGRARVTELRAGDGKDNYRCTLTVDTLVDGIAEGTLVENVTLCPDITLSGNVFTHFPGIRLSGRGRIIYEHNKVSNSMSALEAYDLAEYWYESGRFSDILIQGNRFDGCNAMGGSAFLSFGVSGWGSDAPKIHGRVVLRRNIFIGARQKYQVEGVESFTDEDASATGHR